MWHHPHQRRPARAAPQCRPQPPPRRVGHLPGGAPSGGARTHQHVLVGVWAGITLAGCTWDTAFALWLAADRLLRSPRAGVVLEVAVGAALAVAALHPTTAVTCRRLFAAAKRTLHPASTPRPPVADHRAGPESGDTTCTQPVHPQ